MSVATIRSFSAIALVLALCACGGGSNEASTIAGPASGDDARKTIASVVAEPPGINCAAGGTRIELGFDSNGNGVLDADEVSATPYACNGNPGMPGAAGLSSLVAMDVEPAGSNCASGGTRVRTGLDGNTNGVLDAAEVTATTRISHAGSEPSARSDGWPGCLQNQMERIK